jgi:sugar phosphate isomerase/epimerase
MFFTGIADEAGGSISTQIAAHRALGWQHLELRLIEGANIATMSDAAFDEVAMAVEASGMQVVSFASSLGNWGRPITTEFHIDREELARAVPRMLRLNCPYIRCMSWPNNGMTEAAWQTEVVRRMTVLANMAEDSGVTLIHENCDGWAGQSPAHTLALLDQVDSPALKLVFDTGNPFVHKQDGVDFLRQVVDHVVHVHVKDGYLDATGKEVYTYPNEGSCRVQECLELLLRSGYDEGFSIEPHLAMVVHTSEGVGHDADRLKWDSYLEYGRRTRRLVEKAVLTV